MISKFRNGTFRRIAAALIALAAVVSSNLYAPQNASAEAVGPPSGIMRIGLRYGEFTGATASTGSMESANLQNVTGGGGSGFEFGYYDSLRRFVSVGATTGETKITMMRDMNMRYDSGNNMYVNDSANFDVGCYHIQFRNKHSTYASALAAAESSGIIESFVKYDSGAFYVMSGDFATQSAAASALSSRGYSGSADVNSGTAETVTVVKTGSGSVLFEFDARGKAYLAVRPIAEAGSNPTTWFKGYKYYGGFQYSRPTGYISVINYVSIDDYAKGVVPYEMGTGWPLEALKAQALCARTYAARKVGAHSSSGFDLCTTEHCQVYRGDNNASDNSNRACDETSGQYITYGGDLVSTYYSSSDGGATENCENVWNETLPHLKGVEDPYETAVVSKISNYYWTVSYTPAELTAKLKSRGYTGGTIVSARVTDVTAVGNVYAVEVADASGYKFTIQRGDRIRSWLGLSSIRFNIGGNSLIPSAELFIQGGAGLVAVPKSSELYADAGWSSGDALPPGSIYAVDGKGDTVRVGEVNVGDGSADGKINGKFMFAGAGNGHSIGMSQWGAYSMASVYNMTAEQIVKFYFTGVQITQVDVYGN
ncbi:MAG: SpoIID/LytB domain-containing protein [Oscillospiraceae bacterium]|nr:SpoIID/LytB domain-containing protein [Oscillospiraceae bacterium]